MGCFLLQVLGMSSKLSSETLPAETGLFQENVGTETYPQVGRSPDHRVLPVHLAPRIKEINICL